MNKIRSALTFAVIPTLILWSSFSFATPAPQSPDLQTITQWTQHLNLYFSDLNLSPDTSNPLEFPQVLQELGALERQLHGDAQLPNGTLLRLSCANCVCVPSNCGGN